MGYFTFRDWDRSFHFAIWNLLISYAQGQVLNMEVNIPFMNKFVNIQILHSCPKQTTVKSEVLQMQQQRL